MLLRVRTAVAPSSPSHHGATTGGCRTGPRGRQLSCWPRRPSPAGDHRLLLARCSCACRAPPLVWGCRFSLVLTHTFQYTQPPSTPLRGSPSPAAPACLFGRASHLHASHVCAPPPLRAVHVVLPWSLMFSSSCTLPPPTGFAILLLFASSSTSTAILPCLRPPLAV